MQLEFSPGEVQLRDKVRTWLAENKPREVRPDDGVAMREFDLAWQRKKYAGGWAGIAWPREYGGQGLSLVEQMIWYEECARARAPLEGCLSVALNHAGPHDHRRRDRRPEVGCTCLRSCAASWSGARAFSEPGAGSDLAALRLSAVVDGDSLVLNGQKIWTTSRSSSPPIRKRWCGPARGHPSTRELPGSSSICASPGIQIRSIRDDGE